MNRGFLRGRGDGDGGHSQPDARRAESGLRRDQRREARHAQIWIRAGGAWRAGVILAWFRDAGQWHCWVQHDHPGGKLWPMFDMYVYDPETIIRRDPWDTRTHLLPQPLWFAFVDREERRQFVREHRTCVFGYARKNDGPAMTVVHYLMNGDDELLVSTMAARAKARAAARGGKVSMCILDETWPFRYLQVYGTAEFSADRQLAADMFIRVVGLMSGQEVPESRHQQIAELAEAEQRVVIRVRPYATFETPPRHVTQMSDLDTLSHWTSTSMPW